MKTPIFLILLCLIIQILTVDYPIYNYTYQVQFDQTVIKKDVQYHIKGQLFYDPANNKERVDRQNGRYNAFCGSVLPNVTTPCQSLTVSGNRWIVFPQRSQCCLCCTSAHGCGILAPDWLKESDYMGQASINAQHFDKWHKKGSFTQNYFYATTDSQQLPRRLDEGGSQITDYDIQTFKKGTIPDSVFAVPSYCNVTKPTNCPLTSLCGYFRSNLKSQ